MIIFLKVGHTK